MWFLRHSLCSRALTKASKHTMSDSSLQPFGFGTDDKSKQVFSWDAVSTSHCSPQTFLLQTVDSFGRVPHNGTAGRHGFADKPQPEKMVIREGIQKLWKNQHPRPGHRQAWSYVANCLNHKPRGDKETEDHWFLFNSSIKQEERRPRYTRKLSFQELLYSTRIHRIPSNLLKCQCMYYHHCWFIWACSLLPDKYVAWTYMANCISRGLLLTHQPCKRAKKRKALGSASKRQANA